MIPCVDEIVIQTEFSLKQIDAPMPEAPWTKRCPHYQLLFAKNIEDSTTPKFFNQNYKV